MAPTEGTSQPSHYRRCVSEVGLQLPSTLRNKLPKPHSVSDSSFFATEDTPGEWLFDPDLLKSISCFDALDDSTSCEVAAFDFPTYSQTSVQVKEVVPRKFGHYFTSLV